MAAFGDAKRFVERVNVGDTVFFSHAGRGIVGAATVCGQVRCDGSETLYRDVEFVTQPPERDGELKAMPFGRVSEITGKSFYWPRTIKVPYLSSEESGLLVEKLRRYLEKGD